MSDARSLTLLSDVDYDAIAEAVMETARGRWFLEEYAKRNRRSDTNTVLSAIARLEHAFGTASKTASPAELPPSQSEIAEIGFCPNEPAAAEASPSARPGFRIQRASETILTAAETVQEAAWTLREAGADAELCDRLDRRATDIYAAVADIDALADQLSHVPGRSMPATVTTRPAQFDDVEHELAGSLTPFNDIEMVGIEAFPAATQAERHLPPAPPSPHRFVGAHALDEDIVFAEMLDDVAAAPAIASTARSEADLRAIDALPAEERLKFFA